jgi:putative membrane protein
MKKVMVYSTAMLALAAAPVFAQAGSTRGQSGQAGSAQPTRRSEAGASGPDRMFGMEAAQGGMAEVALGRLAGEKASNDRVKQFGQRMVSDHGKANDELKALAATKNISLPAELDARHKATEDRLSKLSGAAFDRAYVQEMVADHKKDVAAFRKESKSGSDSDVKAWAAKTLPTLEEHSKIVQEISSSLRSGSVGTSGARSTGTGSTGTGAPASGDGTSMPGSGTTGVPGSTTPNGTNNPR